MTKLKKTECAKLTGLSATTIQNAIKSGKLRAKIDSKGSYKVDSKELLKVYPFVKIEEIEEIKTKNNIKKSKAKSKPKIKTNNTTNIKTDNNVKEHQFEIDLKTKNDTKELELEINDLEKETNTKDDKKEPEFNTNNVEQELIYLKSKYELLEQNLKDYKEREIKLLDNLQKTTKMLEESKKKKFIFF